MAGQPTGMERFDCLYCVQKDTCPRAREGTFCTEFQSREIRRDPADSPAAGWTRGEDVDLDGELW